jgi:hypothetical protein
MAAIACHTNGLGNKHDSEYRFSTREAAQEIIDAFHGTVVQGSSSPLQVRFADTEGQKKLKSMFGRKTRSYVPRSGGYQFGHRSGSTYSKPPPFHQPGGTSTPGSSATSSPTLSYSPPPIASPTSTGPAPAYMMAAAPYPMYYHPYPVPPIPHPSSLFSPALMDPSFDAIASYPSSPTQRQRSVSTKNSKSNINK